MEDNLLDAEYIQSILEKEGIQCDVTLVRSKEEYVKNLQELAFDIIFADFTLPSFDGLEALRIAHRLQPAVPFVFVTGTMGEDLAVESLKIGATDYVLKSNLSRLVPALIRALQEAEEIAQRKEAEEQLQKLNEDLERRVKERTRDLKTGEERLRAIINSSPSAVTLKNTDGEFLQVNRVYEETTGLKWEDLRGKTVRDCFPKEIADLVTQNENMVLETGKPLSFEETVFLKPVGWRTYQTERFPLRDEKGEI